MDMVDQTGNVLKIYVYVGSTGGLHNLFFLAMISIKGHMSKSINRMILCHDKDIT